MWLRRSERQGVNISNALFPECFGADITVINQHQMLRSCIRYEAPPGKPMLFEALWFLISGIYSSGTVCVLWFCKRRNAEKQNGLALILL